jgi:hypothetical protein
MNLFFFIIKVFLHANKFVVFRKYHIIRALNSAMILIQYKLSQQDKCSIGNYYRWNFMKCISSEEICLL